MNRRKDCIVCQALGWRKLVRRIGRRAAVRGPRPVVEGTSLSANAKPVFVKGLGFEGDSNA